MRTKTIIEGIERARESTRPKQRGEHEEDPLGENPLEDLYQATLGTHQDKWWELTEDEQRKAVNEFAKDDSEFRGWCAMHDQGPEEVVAGREAKGQQEITRFFWSKIHKQNGN